MAELLKKKQAWEISYTIQSLHDNGPETVAKRFKSLIFDKICKDAVRAFSPFNYYCILNRIKGPHYRLMSIIRHPDYVIIHNKYTPRKIIKITKPARRFDFDK